MDHPGVEIFDSKDLAGRGECLWKASFEVAFECLFGRGTADREVAAVVVAFAGSDEVRFFVTALLLRIGATRRKLAAGRRIDEIRWSA